VGKLWGGRFTKEAAAFANEFGASLKFDQRLYKYDIQGSIVQAKALVQAGVFTPDEAAGVIAALEDIEQDIATGKVQLSLGLEDIHTNIEALLTERVGDLGKKLHTGRSRNDQVALDIRLFLKDEINRIMGLIHHLQSVLLDLAEEHQDTIIPGYTHLQRAQPILLAHHFLAYFHMLERDKERFADCAKRNDQSPLGAGALAGSGYPIDRHFVASELGLKCPMPNSIDAVSARDHLLEFMGASSILMSNLSRLCEELVIWHSVEFGFIEMDDAFATGSSIMPQKKNPDFAELIRGKTGRVYGNLVSLLTTMKGLPLAYNKDMQEDKEPLFDTIDTLTGCLEILAPMLATMKVKKENLAQGVQKGFLTATDLADYLAKRGVPFRQAHEIVGRCVLFCIESNRELWSLSLEELRELGALVDQDVYDHLDPRKSLNNRSVYGGTAPQQVKEAISEARKLLGQQEG
jgi:argininosuccinate lyase